MPEILIFIGRNTFIIRDIWINQSNGSPEENFSSSDFRRIENSRLEFGSLLEIFGLPMQY